MEAFEADFCLKFEKVRLGGIVGATAGKEVATIVYPQPADGEFTWSLITREPKLTVRKLKNGRYRQNKSGRRVICGGPNRRSEGDKRE